MPETKRLVCDICLAHVREDATRCWYQNKDVTAGEHPVVTFFADEHWLICPGCWPDWERLDRMALGRRFVIYSGPWPSEATKAMVMELWLRVRQAGEEHRGLTHKDAVGHFVIGPRHGS